MSDPISPSLTAGANALRRRLLAVGALAACLGVAGPAQAQDAAAAYPERPIRLVVPYPAGSGVDLGGRIIAEQLSEALGQNVFVDNRPGGSTLIGAQYVAKSPADGYTLLVTTNTTSAANPSLFKSLPYDPLKDFVHIGRMNTTSLVLVVNPSLPVKDLAGFIQYVKAAKPAPSAGYWSAGSQVAVATLKTVGGLDLLPVSYKGSPLAVNDLLADHIVLTFSDFASALNNIKAGKLRGIAVTSPKRSPLAPDLPAMAEALPGYDVSTWIGLIAPAGVPDPIVRKLNAALNKALGKPEVAARYASMGMDVAPTSPQEFTRFVEQEIVKWKKQLADAGIQPQ